MRFNDSQIFLYAFNLAVRILTFVRVFVYTLSFIGI